jgi:hypothetical protein
MCRQGAHIFPSQRRGAVPVSQVADYGNFVVQVVGDGNAVNLVPHLPAL